MYGFRLKYWFHQQFERRGCDRGSGGRLRNRAGKWKPLHNTRGIALRLGRAARQCYTEHRRLHVVTCPIGTPTVPGVIHIRRIKKLKVEKPSRSLYPLTQELWRLPDTQLSVVLWTNISIIVKETLLRRREISDHSVVLYTNISIIVRGPYFAAEVNDRCVRARPAAVRQNCTDKVKLPETSYFMRPTHSLLQQQTLFNLAYNFCLSLHSALLESSNISLLYASTTNMIGDGPDPDCLQAACSRTEVVVTLAVLEGAAGGRGRRAHH
ncbi:hypothetical protein J6590_032078 [Homalodisca vitripennis]|nr:hypothetical protein J6590_032078 [Homalodisca vitripennis]